MKLIDKDKVVMKINNWIKDARRRYTLSKVQFSLSDRIESLENLLSFLDTIETKEVDLEKALSDLDKDIKEFVTTEEFERESETCGHYWAIAKHAFLLGLKAQKVE